MPKRNHPTRGFSLIELMVIVGVVSALALIAVPNYLRWRSDEEVKATARAISDAVGLARSESLRTGNNFLVILGGGLGATSDITVVDDGAQAAANCTIDAGEVVFEADLDTEVDFGVNLAGTTLAPDDGGALPANIGLGWTFSDGGGANPASWLLFQNDGIPRTFTSGGGACTAIGTPADGGGGFYVTNGTRDYAVVLRPLGTTRLHRWRGASGWSQ